MSRFLAHILKIWRALFGWFEIDFEFNLGMQYFIIDTFNAREAYGKCNNLVLFNKIMIFFPYEEEIIQEFSKYGDRFSQMLTRITTWFK